MVDAGTSTAGAVARMLDLGAARVIVGTESLPGVAALRALRAALPDAPLVVSLDLRAGRVLSPDPALAGLDAAEALARLVDAGAARGDRARPRPRRLGRGAGRGAAGGPSRAAAGRRAARGRRRARRLRPARPRRAGAAGALVATALHGGAIGGRGAARRGAVGRASSRHRDRAPTSYRASADAAPQGPSGAPPHPAPDPPGAQPAPPPRRPPSRPRPRATRGCRSPRAPGRGRRRPAAGRRPRSRSRAPPTPARTAPRGRPRARSPAAARPARGSPASPSRPARSRRSRARRPPARGRRRRRAGPSPGGSRRRVRSRARGTRAAATSGSSTRAIPKPIDPNSGLTMTSEPRSANAASASSARSQATVRGVGTPAAASSARRQELVDRALDGDGAVDRAHAGRIERVQRVDAEDDLLERPARDAAHDHDVARVEGDLAAAHGDAAVDPARQPRHRREGAGVPARGQRALQALRVPASGGAENRDAQAHAPPGGGRMRAARGLAMRTLLIDNYDSYTFNLFHLLGEVNGEEPIVVRNDDLPWDDLAALRPDNIVISPGPGRPEHPRDAGVSLEVLRRAEVPVLGVCLGHQDLAYVCGGTIEHAPEVMHGRLSRIHHDESDAVRRDPAGLPRRPLPLARGRRRAAGAARDGLDAGRRGHGARASHAPAVRRPVPPRVRQHATRPRAAGELPRPRPRSAPRAAPRDGARNPRRRPAAPQPPGTVRARARASSRPGASPRPSSAPCSPPTTTPSGSTAPAAGPASRASRSSARPTGRSARSCAYDVAAGTVTVERATGREEHAESVFDYCRRELAACAPTRPSCRSTSSAGSPATSATSSRPSAARAHADLDAPDAALLLCDRVVAFDHRERRIHLSR